MDLNNKNGQPSMEEILASIRRIIAEEPTAANPVIDLHARHRKSDSHDDGNDFELPSIFRPSAPTPERQPLFGRLTDAIRSASGGGEAKQAKGDDGETQDRYRGALRDAGSILALASSPGGLEHNGSDAERYRGALRDSGGNNSLSSALSSLKLTRGAEAAFAPEPIAPVAAAPQLAPIGEVMAPAAVMAPTAHAAPPPPSPAPAARVETSPGAVEDVRRVMVPFRDMRMSRMAGATPAGGADPTPSDAVLQSVFDSGVAASAPVVDFPVPVQDPYQALPPIPAPPQSFDAAFSLDDMHRFATVVEPPPAPPVAVAPAGDGIEDATADLLRPMLRQWLAENMPRMVEKALSIELAESVKQTRKFSGY